MGVKWVFETGLGYLGGVERKNGGEQYEYKKIEGELYRERA